MNSSVALSQFSDDSSIKSPSAPNSKLYILILKANKIKFLKKDLLIAKKKNKIPLEFKGCIYVNSADHRNHLLVEVTSQKIIRSVISSSYIQTEIKNPLDSGAIFRMVNSLSTIREVEVLKIGDYVKVSIMNYNKYGRVQSVDLEKQKVVVNIIDSALFIPVELPISKVKKVNDE